MTVLSLRQVTRKKKNINRTRLVDWHFIIRNKYTINSAIATQIAVWHIED